MAATDTRWLVRKLFNTPLSDLLRGRLTARYDWDWLIESAGLPDPVVRLLRKLVAKTLLRELEKVEVAQRLVRQVQDAMDQGLFAEQAIEPLQPWRKTAKQIRREFWRRRSWLGRAPRYVCLGFWALAVLYVFYGLTLTINSPEVSIDYVALLNEEAAAVPEADRAWPVLRDAMIAMELVHRYSDERFGDEATAADEIGAGPGDEHWPMVLAFLETQQPAIAELRRAVSMPGLGFVVGLDMDPEDVPLFDPRREYTAVSPEVAAYRAEHGDDTNPFPLTPLRQLWPLRQACRVLYSDALRAAEVGDAATAYADIMALLDLARHADEQKMLICEMTAIAICRAGLAATSRVIADNPALLSDEQLVGLSQQIKLASGYQFDLRGEQYLLHDLIQHLYTDNGRGSGCLYLPTAFRHISTLARDEERPGAVEVALMHLLSVGISPVAKWGTVDRREMRALVDEAYALYAADMKVPVWEQPESRGDAMFSEALGSSILERLRYAPVAYEFSGMGRMRGTLARFVCDAEAAMAGIALERYRREHNGYPDSLDALVPGYLDVLPTDPIHGGPLKYVLIDDRPVLYSVGEDWDDDGGRWPLDADGEVSQSSLRFDLDEEEEPIDGDWIAWPQHDETEPEEDDPVWD